MEDILQVRQLCKHYPAFTLDNVSFSLQPGKITGFIGRNGAGKSTTLNALFNLVHPDSGEIAFFGKPFSAHEMEAKQQVGFVSSGIQFYPGKKLKTITAVTKMFYEQWDDTAYKKYMELFKLDERKNPNQLSAGMKVKYALALALSHNAKLLILDEPTSGLDPVSRDDLLEVFMNLCDEGKSILFSTHIITDLERCADNIIYIKSGRILSECAMADFEKSYKLVHFEKDALSDVQKALLIGTKRSKTGYTALVPAAQAETLGAPCENADLESIMVHLEKEDEE